MWFNTVRLKTIIYEDFSFQLPINNIKLNYKIKLTFNILLIKVNSSNAKVYKKSGGGACKESEGYEWKESWVGYQQHYKIKCS